MNRISRMIVALAAYIYTADCIEKARQASGQSSHELMILGVCDGLNMAMFRRRVRALKS